ncbi:MAG TPA: nucleotide exchange factor GrpE [Candidatus Saccharimonadales bacterium]|nr:nucleotide exchange factor GrpE [Candidatus Saccharimonadales bacterium]
MTIASAPRLNKLPFYLADLFLLAVAGWIVLKCPNPFQPWPLLALLVCAGLGAWLSIIPFLKQYEADVDFADSNNLTSAVEQINNLRTFTNQISFATAQWAVVQEQSAKTVATSREIADRINAESKDFTEFLQKANDSEKGYLRLEVEKLRRSEAEWLHVVVRVLDHVYALYLAGVNSGQPNLLEQLSQFQHACRDAARRVGVTAFEPKPGEAYQEKTHQLADPKAQPTTGAQIAQVLAPGFSFQGQMIRQAVVILQPPVTSSQPLAKPEASVAKQLPPAEQSARKPGAIEKSEPVAAKPAKAETPLLFQDPE